MSRNYIKRCQNSHETRQYTLNVRSWESWCFPRLCLGKRQYSRENKTNCFPRDLTLISTMLRSCAVMYPERGTIVQMYHERVMHALHVCSQHSFGLLLRMNGMHRTHFNPARLDLLSLVIWSRLFWLSQLKLYGKDNE